MATPDRSILERLKTDAQVASANVATMLKDIKRAAAAEFLLAGGCKSCRGRGWIVTWDTTDSMTGCYHESAQCLAEGCSPESRAASGLSPENNKYDKFHSGSGWKMTEEQDRAYQVVKIAARMAESAHQHEVDRWSLRKGVIVEVTSQRARGKNRLALGTRAEVIGFYENSWGTTKVILKDPNGDKLWTTKVDLTVIDPEPDLLSYGIKPDTGFPFLLAFKKVTASGKAVIGVNPLSGNDVCLPLSQILRITRRKDDKVQDVDMKLLKWLDPGTGISVYIPTWLAKKSDLLTGED
jgi:hypothetical protein